MCDLDFARSASHIGTFHKVARDPLVLLQNIEYVVPYHMLMMSGAQNFSRVYIYKVHACARGSGK